MFAIAVLNQKGGVGKSTIAVNLAAAGLMAGKRTVLLDLDRQGSILDWCAARAEQSALAALAASKVTQNLSVPLFRELTAGFDLAVLDAPPQLGELTSSAAVAADVVVLPVSPGPYDIWSTDETTGTLDHADQVRAKLGRSPVRRIFVVNRAITGTVLAREAHKAIGDMGEVAAVVLHSRVAFAEAAAVGESVLTYEPDGPAADEIRALYKLVADAGTNGRRKASHGKINQPRG